MGRGPHEYMMQSLLRGLAAIYIHSYGNWPFVMYMDLILLVLCSAPLLDCMADTARLVAICHGDFEFLYFFYILDIECTFLFVKFEFINTLMT